MSASAAYPIYIPSKGRWKTRSTMLHLDAMGVDYRVIVEEAEFAAYSAVIDKAKLLALDPAYQRDYDAFWPVPDGESKGSGPARNFALDHAVAAGAPWHWVIDDNIRGFFRLNHNRKIPVGDGAIFGCMETFVERYTNVAMAGPHCITFVHRKAAYAPLVLNTRIYSCTLMRTDTGFRWRGRYNEDTDLCLRMLKAGWCTVLFQAFLQGKATTRTISGGNTDTIYTRGTLDKSRMLVAMHPDVAQLSYRWDRWHHSVDYSRFKDMRLIPRPGVRITRGVDNFGMRLVSKKMGRR